VRCALFWTPDTVTVEIDHSSYSSFKYLWRRSALVSSIGSHHFPIFWFIPKLALVQRKRRSLNVSTPSLGRGCCSSAFTILSMYFSLELKRSRKRGSSRRSTTCLADFMWETQVRRGKQDDGRLRDNTVWNLKVGIGCHKFEANGGDMALYELDDEASMELAGGRWIQGAHRRGLGFVWWQSLRFLDHIWTRLHEINQFVASSPAVTAIITSWAILLLMSFLVAYVTSPCHWACGYQMAFGTASSASALRPRRC